MISASELAALQGVFLTYFDKTCAIQRDANMGSSDAYGTVAGPYTTVPGLGAVPCSLTEPSSTYMQNLAARLGNQAAWTLSLPIGTDVRARDRVVIGADTFTVQNLGEPHSYPLCTQALISEVR